MHRITEVKPLPGHRVWLRFDDGVQGEVDLSELVGKGVFASWTDEEKFAEVFVDSESHTIAWPGGIDLCPTTLHRELSGVKTS